MVSRCKETSLVQNPETSHPLFNMFEMKPHYVLIQSQHGVVCISFNSLCFLSLGFSLTDLGARRSDGLCLNEISTEKDTWFSLLK